MTGISHWQGQMGGFKKRAEMTLYTQSVKNVAFGSTEPKLTLIINKFQIKTNRSSPDLMCCFL